MKCQPGENPLNRSAVDVFGHRDMVYSPTKYRETEGIKVRAVGYDLSQAKLEAIALSLGIDKTVASMTQAEKAQLRYYAIMTQVTEVQGDMARTLESPANQLRIFSSSVTQAGRAIGNIFIPALNKALPYLIASLHVIEDIADEIARLLGFTMSDIEWDKELSFGEQMEEDIEGANGAAKKLKNFLMGFDELNVISADDGSGSGDDNGIGDFDFKLPEYDFLGDAVNTKVNEIEEKLRGILGIGEGINGWTDLWDSTLADILFSVGAIGAALAGLKLSSDVASVIPLLLKGASFIGTLMLAAAGLAMYIQGIYDAVTSGLDELNGALVALGGTMIGTAIGFVVGGPMGALIGAGIGLAVGLVTDLVLYIIEKWDTISEHIAGFGDWFNEHIVVPVREKCGDLLDGFAKVGNWFKVNIIIPVATVVSDVYKYAFEKAKNLILDVWEAGKVIFSKIGEIFLKIGEIANAVGGWVYEHIVTPVVDGFLKIWDKTAWLRDKLTTIFTDIGKFIVDVWDNIFSSAINMIIGKFEGIINSFIQGLNFAIDLVNKIPGVEITKVEELSVPRVGEYARGGFPDEGELFVAREAGAEMVGSVGGKTAVANNDQIVEAVSAGVYQAVLSAMKQSGGENTPSLNVYLDGRQIASSVKRANKERGASILGNEVYSY